MRFTLAVVLLAPAILAQESAEPHNYWHFQAPPGAFVAPFNPVPKAAPKALPQPAPPVIMQPAPKVCSIPLLNVLAAKPADLDRMAIPIPPREADRASMAYVTPPAPPCDDKKR